MIVRRKTTIDGLIERLAKRSLSVPGVPLADSVVVAPSARVYRSGSQEIPTGAVTPVTFDAERWDSDALHSNVSNTGRLTAPVAGIYTVSGHCAWEAAEITGFWFMAIRVNGGSVYAAQWSPAAFQSEASTHTEVKLAAGDYVELALFQNTGKTIKTAGPGKSNYPNGLELTMTWLTGD